MNSGHVRTMRRERTRPATVPGARDRAERLWNEAVAHPCAPAADDANGSNPAHLPLSSSQLVDCPQAPGARSARSCAPRASTRDATRFARGAVAPSGPAAREGEGETQATTGSSPSPSLPSGPATGKLRALWNSAYDLGLIHDRSDGALGAWLHRLAGLDDDACIETASLDRPIQALKAWLARTGGVDWRPHVSLGQDGRVRERRRPRARVLEAQWRLLHRQGRVRNRERRRAWRLRRPPRRPRPRRLAPCAQQRPGRRPDPPLRQVHPRGERAP